jgi:hypothetical protein
MEWLGPPCGSGSTGSDGLGNIYIQEQKQNGMVGTILGSGSIGSDGSESLGSKT